MPKSSSTKKGYPCSECPSVIANKGDLPRHMRLHAVDKQNLMHRCTWQGCNYANLQKSNLLTHEKTHTRNKDILCPDCDFTTNGPSSLTRHRKKQHGYVPKSRNGVKRVAPDPRPPIATTRQARRPVPYPSLRRTHSSRASSATSESTSSSASTVCDQPASIESEYTAVPSSHYLDSYFWHSQDGERISRSPSPRPVLPAVDTGRHMEYSPHCEEAHTQVLATIAQMQRSESSATICPWNNIGVPDVNDCSVDFGQQFIPQYLLGGYMAEPSAADYLDFVDAVRQNPDSETNYWQTMPGLMSSASVPSVSPASSFSQDSPSFSSCYSYSSANTDDFSSFFYSPEFSSLAYPATVSPACDPTYFSDWRFS